MAIIYSNRNDNTSSHTTVSANTTTTWLGGVLPVGVDQVYVVGRRTTINQVAFDKWTGTRTITVASTANFASTGFFYTVTNGGEIAKVNYTGTTGTTFTGCSVDETDSFYSWTSGQQIPNGTYVHNPAYIINIASGQTFECNELIIEQGGWLNIASGGTLKVNQGIILRDGRLVGSGSGTIIISRPAGTAAASTVGYLNAENFPLSVLDIDGGENRTYATLSSQANAGNTSISVSGVTNGSFAVGDEIAVYEYNDYRRRNVGYTGYRDITANFKDMDEGLDVVGVSGGTIYVGMRNGAKGTIKSVETVSSQKVVEVSLDDIYFNAGDKIVINNASYTIDSITESEYTLYDYDFTNPVTDLSDFWVNDATHVYSSGWTIESGIGLRNTSGAYRELVHKFLWTRECVVEAEMSPLSAYTSGTLGNSAFGILTAYDPAFRWGHRGFDGFKSDYFVIDDVNQDMYFVIRSMSSYPNNRPDRVAGVLSAIRQPATYKVDSRKHRTTCYFNGNEFTTEHRRDGHFKGLVGIFNNTSTNFRCRRLTIKVPTQKLYITTTDSITTASGPVYQSGIDHTHPSGSRVVKIASINTGTGNHQDLAFAYRGQSGSGVWPLIIQRNGTNATNAEFPYLHNHDMNVDYFHNLTETTAQVGVTIDLTSQQTFTHVSFVPRVNDSVGFYGYNNVAIYGSNDLTNWTTLYGPTNDTKKWYGAGGSYNRMAFYPTGTVSFRYVKFETRGDQGGANRNRYVNLGVHNFSDGFKLTLNNASDFAIGDTITVLTDGGYSIGSRELEAFQSYVTAAAGDPENYYHGGWVQECTITDKVGDTLYLNKPVWWGYIEGGADSAKIVKTNRNFVITGEIGASSSFNDWRRPSITYNAGTNLARKYLMRNTRLSHIGSYRYSGSTNFNRGVVPGSQDYWNNPLFDGVVYMMGSDSNNPWTGFGANSGIWILRNSTIVIVGAIYGYITPSFSGCALFNNKIMSLYRVYSDSLRSYAINYNEIATCDQGIQFVTARTDRSVIPSFNEIRYNSIKGTSNIGIFLNSETVGTRRLWRVRIENNKFRGMDDHSNAGSTFDGWPYVSSNAMAEHTGSRLSRYRNEGHVLQGDTSSNLSAVSRQVNFNRFGYDLAYGVFDIYELDPSRPDVTRIYRPNSDRTLPSLGVELEILDNVPFQIQVKLDYRFPLMANLQDDGIQDGALEFNPIQNGTLISGTQYTVTPSTAGIGWNTFTYTFNTYSASYGKASLYMGRDSRNGYVDIRNSSATILTDYPDKIRVIGNTFNLANLWDQHRENRDKSSLTAPTRTININRMKF
jgi:hypothetical protein